MSQTPMNVSGKTTNAKRAELNLWTGSRGRLQTWHLTPFDIFLPHLHVWAMGVLPPVWIMGCGGLNIPSNHCRPQRNHLLGVPTCSPQDRDRYCVLIRCWCPSVICCLAPHSLKLLWWDDATPLHPALKLGGATALQPRMKEGNWWF